MRLGQVEAAELPARDERLDPALAQGVVADAGDRRRDGVVHRDREGERSIAAAELLEHRHRLGEREAEAAVRRCDEEAGET